MENAKSQRAKIIQLTLLDNERRTETFLDRIKSTQKKNGFHTQRQSEPKHLSMVTNALKMGTKMCNDKIGQSIRKVLNNSGYGRDDQ